MSVNSYLTNLASRLVLSPEENSSITTSINTLSSRLDSYFGGTITRHFKFGSSTRGTILPRRADSNSDIDYMVVFNVSDGLKKPQTYLDRLRRFASDKYSTSEIYQSHPTLVLELNHIKFELIPAVPWLLIFGYQIPSPSSSWSDWMQTNPNAFNQKLTEKNKSNNSQIKPLIRLIKYWNANNGYPWNSFLLEDFICDQYYWFSSTLKDFFYKFWGLISYDYGTPQSTKDKIDKAKQCVSNARTLEQNGYADQAQAEIEKLLPPF